MGGMQGILTESKAHQFFAVANGLVDRVDRFMIGLILPIAYLAKYALLSSIVSFARFLPDSAIKLYLFKHHRSEERIRIDYSIRTVGFIAICGLLFVVISQGFILVAFGNDWLLPTSVGALLVIQEILRGNYQLSAMKLIAAGKTSEISRISGVLIFTSISLIVIAVHVVGVWGAPSAMVMTYLITTVLVEKKLKEISNGN
jgi:O-antigen/teichoic acid export membrane protein